MPKLNTPTHYSRTPHLLSSIEEHFYARRYGLSDTQWMTMTAATGLKEFLLLDSGARAALARQYGGEPRPERERQFVENEWAAESHRKKKPSRPTIDWPAVYAERRQVTRMVKLATAARQERWV